MVFDGFEWLGKSQHHLNQISVLLHNFELLQKSHHLVPSQHHLNQISVLLHEFELLEKSYHLVPHELLDYRINCERDTSTGSFTFNARGDTAR